MAEIQLLLTAMDRLWFHHVILLSEPISIIYSKSCVVSSPISSQSSTSSADSLQSEEDKVLTNSPASSVSQDGCKDEVKEEGNEAMTEIQRPVSPKKDHIVKKCKSRGPSHSLYRPCRSMNYYDDIHRHLKFMHRSLSCRTAYDVDLEQQELQGFMDLGFQFEKDQLSPRTMSVIPGLQRLGEGHVSTFNVIDHEGTPIFDGKEYQDGEFDEKRGLIIRPYLSEAWKVKRPNSPLLRLRMARVTTTEGDMKKCLKLWAKTVATSIHVDP